MVMVPKTSRVFSPGRMNNYLELPESKNISFIVSEQQGKVCGSDAEKHQFYVYAGTTPNPHTSSRGELMTSLTQEPVLLLDCSQIEDLSDISSVALKTEHGEETLANALQDAWTKA